MRMPRGVRHVLDFLRQYATFFLLVAFVITCCTMLFVHVLSNTLGIEMTDENISLAAKMTFVNVTLISLLFTVMDRLRRYMTVTRPIRRLVDAADRMVKGDFSVRIKPLSRVFSDESFNDIAACFNHMAEELSGVETLRTDFIANVSHEMKTPLAVMQNYGTLLQAPGLSEAERIEYAKTVTESSRRLASMMTNILKLNRLENQQIYPHTQTYDLGEQLCECLLQFEQVWEREEIEIETEICQDVCVHADAELLSLVWNNLLSNAFKFTPRGGRVSLSLRVEGRYAYVCVKDTGCGMSAEVGAHIFEKFYQGDFSHATQGNGLGLALVKRVADIMHAQLQVESELGRGTAFTVRLERVEHE